MVSTRERVGTWLLRGANIPVDMPLADPSVRGAQVGGPVAKANVRNLRAWSRRNPWIRAAINLRRQQVARAKWGIIYDDEDNTGAPPASAVAPIKELLRRPNPKGESWRSLIEPVVEDIIVLDQGCIELEATVGGRLGVGKAPPIAHLWSVDGGTIRIDPLWDGSDPLAPRYFQYDAAGHLIQSFVNTELAVIMAQPLTYSPVGLSALEVLADTIDADLRAAEYASKQVRQAAPPGILDLGEGIRPDQVDAFRAYWDAEIAGKTNVAITGGGKGTKWVSMGQSATDMQFLEWQVYLARKICAVMGCQPQDIGISFDVNRSTAEAGQESTEDNGIGPLMDLVSEYVTREIVWRFDPSLRFAFTEHGRQSQAAAAAYYPAAVGLPWVRVNDALRERGSEGIGEVGDELWVPTPSGPVPMSIYLDNLLNPPEPPPMLMPGAVAPAPGAGEEPTSDEGEGHEQAPSGGAAKPGGKPGADDSGGAAAAKRVPFGGRRLTDFYRPRALTGTTSPPD